MKKYITSILLFAIMLSGCVSLREPLYFKDTNKDKEKLVDNGVILFDSSTTVPADYESLGNAAGKFCHRNTLDSGISMTKVKNLLKEHAKELGANGVIDVECSVETKTDWAKNCWGTAICQGEAIKFEQNK